MSNILLTIITFARDPLYLANLLCRHIRLPSGLERLPLPRPGTSALIS